MIQVIGLPADGVRGALAATPLRLLPLAEDAILTLSARGTGCFAFTIPRGAYAKLPEDVPTIATAALLLAASDLTDVEVEAVTRYVYAAGGDLVARGSAQGAQIAPASAQRGLPVPIHAAAEKVLRELQAAGGGLGGGGLR